MQVTEIEVYVQHLPEAFVVVSVFGECRHEHSSSERESFQQKLGVSNQLRRKFLTCMVQQAAVALSWDAVLYLGYKMRIPRSPALVPLKDEENHKLGMQLPAEAVSWLSMVRIGTQPMITLPVCEGCASTRWSGRNRLHVFLQRKRGFGQLLCRMLVTTIL